MGVLATLLGHMKNQYGVNIGFSEWRTKADEVAAVLRESMVGGYNQPYMGFYTGEGAVTRPKFYGSQMFVWDVVPIVNASSGQSENKLGITGFSWLRSAINYWLGLPLDDADWVASTVETTATFAQYWRVYMYYKYGATPTGFTLRAIPGTWD